MLASPALDCLEAALDRLRRRHSTVTDPPQGKQYLDPFRPAILTGRPSVDTMVDGGSRKGSIGNAVRASSHNAAAAPATVSGEPPTIVRHWGLACSGKAVGGDDPRARR